MTTDPTGGELRVVQVPARMADGWVELGTASAEVNGIELSEGHGHDYLVEGTTTLHNIAAVVMGRPEEMVLR